MGVTPTLPPHRAIGLMHHDADEVKLHAFEATVLVFNSVFWSLLAVVVFREPSHGLIWLLGPLLSTVGALSEENRALRARAIFINLFQFGALQWFFSALAPNYFLIALSMPLVLYVTSFRRHGNNSGAVMVAGIMNFEKGQYLLGLDTFGLVVGLSALIVATYLILDCFFFGKNEWGGSLAVPPLNREAVIRRSIAFGIALMLYDCVDWEYAYWIPLTVGLAYSGGSSGEAVRRIARLRMIWAPVGFSLAALWLSTVGYINYQFNYLAFFWAFAGFYYCFRADDYIGFYLLFMVMISGANNLSYGSSPLYGNGWALVTQSTASVMFGALVVLVCEWFPESKENTPANPVCKRA